MLVMSPIIFLLLLWGCAVWKFQEKKFLRVRALPPSMRLLQQAQVSVYPMLQTLWSVPIEFKWVSFWKSFIFFWTLFHLKLVDLMFGQRQFPLTCAHWNVTAAPSESICRLSGMLAVFFSFSFPSWHCRYLCAFFRIFRNAGPRHRCVLVLQAYNSASYITNRPGGFSVYFLQGKIWLSWQPHAKQ